MKRTSSVFWHAFFTTFIVVAMMYTGLSLKAYAKNADGYSANFNDSMGWGSNDGFANGAAQNGWKFSTNASGNVVKILDQGSGDHCLNFITYPSAHTQWPAAQLTFPVTTSRFTDLEFKTYFEANHSAGFTVQALYSNAASDASSNWVDLMSVGAYGSNAVVEKISSTTIISSLSTGTYSKFNIRYDNNADGAGTKKIYIFRDGQYIATLSPATGYESRSGIQGIRFTMASTAYDANYRIDDVFVSQYADVSSDYSINFNSGAGWAANTGFSNNQKYNGWTFSTYTPDGNGNGNIIKVVDQGSGDNCLNIITSAAHSKWPQAACEFVPTTKRYTNIEFRTLFAAGHNNGFNVGVKFSDAATTWVDLLKISANGGVVNKLTGAVIISPTLSNGSYIKFRIRYDNTSKTIYLYRNDEYVMTISTGFASSKTSLMAFRFNSDSTDTNADIKIDDVFINESDSYISSSFEDQNGVKLQNISSGHTAARVNITNPSLTAAMPYTIIYASYKGEMLTNITTVTDVVPTGGIMVKTPSFSLDDTQGSVKVMVWDHLNAMVPYASPSVLK